MHPSDGYFGHAPGPPLRRCVAIVALDDGLAARVAMRVAALGGWPLVDVVRGVAHQVGRTPTTAELRLHEPALLRRATSRGQGAVLAVTRDALITDARVHLHRAVLVYLRADPGPDVLARAELEARREGYEAAPVVLDVDGVPPQVLAAQIVDRVRAGCRVSRSGSRVTSTSRMDDVTRRMFPIGNARPGAGRRGVRYAVLMPDRESIGAFVRRRRLAHGMTQRELSELAVVGTRFVSELERDKPTLRLDAVRRVLAVFGADLRAVETREAGR